MINKEKNKFVYMPPNTDASHLCEDLEAQPFVIIPFSFHSDLLRMQREGMPCKGKSKKKPKKKKK